MKIRTADQGGSDFHLALLRSVADRQEITQQIYLYCRAMDRIDAELGYSIWHADGVADYGEAVFRGSGRGFIDWVCERHSEMLGHSHQVSNIIIALDGDTAGSESYVTAALRFRIGERLVERTVRGRYADRWSRRDGRWAIDRRIYIHDLDDQQDVVSMEGPPGIGRRDRTDPSYAILTGDPE